MGKNNFSKKNNKDKPNFNKKIKFDKNKSFSKGHKNKFKFSKNKNRVFYKSFDNKKNYNSHPSQKEFNNDKLKEKGENNIKVVQDNEKKENKDNNEKENVNNIDIKNNQNNEEKKGNKINDDNMKEIFIRNIGYTTSEEKLKELFTQLIPESSIEFCLLCKDKETQNNKGSAFIKLTKESYNKVMALYNEYSHKKSNFNEMNPFELEGRYLKLFDAMTREELKNLEKEKEQKNSKRNKTYLYYGLSKETILKFKEYENINEKDKEKRERLIQIKKENYYKNPNFHVSETRISFRNLDKNINENILKEKINETLNNNEEYKKEYKNIKLIKQIKLLREDDDKSKCVAFVECFNFDIAKYLIDNLSGVILNEKSQKGLIIDFSLDDFRKRLSREKKLERLREVKMQLKIEKREKRRKELKNIDENNKKDKKVELKDITDINTLIDLYHTTLSRGKKQRIKKKLKNLGYTKDIPPVEIKKDKIINIKENNNNRNDDDYVKIKISNNKTELNKKMKNKIKQNKKEERNKNFTGKKRERENFGFGEDEEKINRKKEKREKKAFNASKNIINEKIDIIKKSKNKKKLDKEDDDLEMKDYFSKIEENLAKNP